MIFLYSRYVAFALFFIMFGLAIIAASLNLMVLKFMTLNTEDEKRDEQQAIQVHKWQVFSTAGFGDNDRLVFWPLFRQLGICEMSIS